MSCTKSKLQKIDIAMSFVMIDVALLRDWPGLAPTGEGAQGKPPKSHELDMGWVPQIPLELNYRALPILYVQE